MGRRLHPLWGIFVAILLLIPGMGAATAQARLLSDQDRERYGRALEAVERGTFDQALAEAEKGDSPPARKLVEWLVYSDAASEAGFHELAAFLDQNPHWPGMTALRRKAEAAMPEDLAAAEALLWFDKRRPVSATGILRYAEALEAAGRSEEATAQIRRAWTRHDLTEAQERAVLQRYQPILQTRDNVNRLDRLLWKRRVGPARRQARRIGYDYLALAEARLLTALRRKGAKEAVKKVPEALRDDPGLVYERARWHRRMRDYEGVIAYLDPPRPEAPYPKTWWSLRRWAAREAIERKDYEVAYRIASSHGFERGVGYAEGEWLAGWVALRFLDDAKLAYQHFTRLYHNVTTGVSRARGAFWAGEAAEAKGDTKWVKHWRRIAANLSATFYGQMAAERLGQTTLRVDLPEPPEPDDAAHKSFHQRELVRVVRVLGELDQADVQKRFFLHLIGRAETASDYLLTARLAAAQNRPDLAVRTAKAARNKGVILREHLYPAPRIEIVKDLDPRLVYALIRQESGFYTAAKSHAGARGLMQLMPATAKRVARRLKVSYDRRKLTEDPDFNLRLGQAYIKTLLERFDGSYILALAGYNAGPKRVDEWIVENGDPRDPDVDPIGWIERIPFSETRNYVQRVLESVPVYNARLAAEELAIRPEWIDAPYHGAL